MYDTHYVKTSSITEAAKALSAAKDGKLLAGGMTLIPTMKQRLASPDCLVDLSGCNLSNIGDQGNSVKIGAMTTHADVANSEIIQKEIPAVAYLAGKIGDRQVRERGTIGGSVANNDPSACYPSAVMGLGGIIHTSARNISAEDFFTGMFETALEDGEIIEGISLPKPEKAAYVKFPNPASRYAMVGVFIAKFDDNVRCAVTGAGENGVFRCKEIESALSTNFSSKALDQVSLSAEGLMNDIHAGANYRASLIVEMAKRATAAC